MEKVRNINPQRIAWCCEEQGLTIELLAEEVGIALGTLQRAMGGEDALSIRQLGKIAAQFNRGMLFFLEPGAIDAEHVYTPQFRTIANQKPHLSAKVKSIVERVERQRSVYLSLREELGAEETCTFEPPELPRNNPKRAASIVREWLGLNAANDFDSYRAAVESKGILVFRSNGYNGAWQIPKDDPIIGFSLYHEVCPVIVVKKEFASTRQSFTLMHELGHVLLDLSSYIDDKDDLYLARGQIEERASAFAGCLLVPDKFLGAIHDGDRPEDVAKYDSWLEDKRRAWGVSGEVILRRLLDVGRLDQARYTAYRTWSGNRTMHRADGGSREWRHREPKHVFGDTFVRTILDALSANHITLNKASSYLDNLKIRDLHRLEGFYASI